MPNAVFFNSYKLKSGKSADDFKLAVAELVKSVAVLKGFVEFKLMRDGDNWADYTTWETMEDAKNFAENGGQTEAAQHFYSFLNFNTCVSRFYDVESSK